jgi:hypothetical protein
MKLTDILCLGIAATAIFCFIKPAGADDATVLPKGIFSLRLDSQFFATIKKRFDEDGNTEDLAEDFNTNLNSSVFPQLGQIEQAFGMAPGTASIGESDVSLKYDVKIFDFYLYYGLTDRLTIGAKIPYWTFKSSVDTEVDNTNATLVKNPFLDAPVDPFMGSPLVPSSLVPDALQDPVTTDDVQNLLQTEFGYKPLENWSHNGLSDIEFGGRYQYFKSDNWRLAFLGALRAPTGRTDDPDNLVDFPFGLGSWAVLLHANNDFIGWKNFMLNGTFVYEYYLSHKEQMRIPDDADQIATGNKEKVDITPGDIVKFEFEGRYNVTPSWMLSLFYRYTRGFEWDIDGDEGFDYDQAEEDTDFMSQQYRVGITYSTFPLYQAKKFALPLTARLYFRDRFAGENITKSRYVGLDVAVFFSLF